MLQYRTLFMYLLAYTQMEEYSNIVMEIRKENCSFQH